MDFPDDDARYRGDNKGEKTQRSVLGMNVTRAIRGNTSEHFSLYIDREGKIYGKF